MTRIRYHFSESNRPDFRAPRFSLQKEQAAISAPERGRDKTRAIKQGMMQQLQTGRARLVDTVRKQMGKD